MIKALIYLFGGLAAFTANFIVIQSLVLRADPWVLFAGHFKSPFSALLFAIRMISMFVFSIYALARIRSERKIKQTVNALPIPVRTMRPHSLPGFRLPYPCNDLLNMKCRGVLVSTTVCEPHSLASMDGKVLFPHSDNRCRINIGLLAQYRQELKNEDRLFCTDCGVEYDWRVIQPMKHPLNLYNILSR